MKRWKRERERETYTKKSELSRKYSNEFKMESCRRVSRSGGRKDGRRRRGMRRAGRRRRGREKAHLGKEGRASGRSGKRAAERGVEMPRLREQSRGLGHRLEGAGPRVLALVDHVGDSVQLGHQEGVQQLLQGRPVVPTPRWRGRVLRRSDAVPIESPESLGVGKVKWCHHRPLIFWLVFFWLVFFWLMFFWLVLCPFLFF